jgi:hypothetical protein
MVSRRRSATRRPSRGDVCGCGDVALGGLCCAMSFGPGKIAETMLLPAVFDGPSLQPTDIGQLAIRV